ncbi:hypothetical protein [Desulfospira joergensenii]|nr:hypothetical protein [Desulfospira joergensenii]
MNPDLMSAPSPRSTMPYHQRGASDRTMTELNHSRKASPKGVWSDNSS